MPPGQPVTLRIKARRSCYSFAFTVNSQTEEIEQTVPTSAFTPLFTGVHLGLYAQGANEISCLTPAYFAHTQWTKA